MNRNDLFECCCLCKLMRKMSEKSASSFIISLNYLFKLCLLIIFFANCFHCQLFDYINKQSTKLVGFNQKGKSLFLITSFPLPINQQKSCLICLISQKYAHFRDSDSVRIPNRRHYCWHASSCLSCRLPFCESVF